MRFGYLDEVWAQKPVFFHGYVIGYFKPKGGELTWICQSVGGTLLHVKDEDLRLSMKQQPLMSEGKIKQ